MTSEAGQAPATEAGTEMHFYMLGFLSAAVPERDRRKVLETVRRYTLAIEAEAVAAERAHWHRTPGTYRTEEATEVVVDLPESLSWLADEFPDEVNAIVAAKRARIAEAVRGLPSGVGRVGSRSVSVVDRAAVLAAIDGATPK